MKLWVVVEVRQLGEYKSWWSSCGHRCDVPLRYEAMSLRQAYDHVLERRTIADPRKDGVLEGDVRVR